MKKILLLIFLHLTIQSFSQRVAIDYGDVYFEFFHFREAAKYYQEALEISTKPKQRLYLYEQLSQCYKYLFEYRKSEEYFKMIMTSGGDVKPEYYIDYGNILKLNGKYNEARKQFKKYQDVTGTDLAEPFIRSVNWAIRNADTIKNYETFPTNLDISGQALGYCFYDDGLIYSHERTKPNAGKADIPVFDLDYARKESNTEFMPDLKIMDFIQFDLNEGAPSVSKDGMFLFFSANSQQIKRGKTKSVGGVKVSSDGVSNFQIYVAANEGGMFQNPVPVAFNDEDYSFVHPFISEDGNVLFFSSNMPGGFGGFDIWKSLKDETGKWGDPVNMGKVINTEENELFPWCSDGLIYFSSKGFNGYGGYDIFVARLNKFLLPSALKNIGQPINSYRDDVAFITKDGGRTGYFSSNRDNEDGADFVYYFNEVAPRNELGEPVVQVNPPAAAPAATTGVVAQKEVSAPPPTSVPKGAVAAGGVVVAATAGNDKSDNKANSNPASGETVAKAPVPVALPVADKEHVYPAEVLLNKTFTPVQFKFNDAGIDAANMQAADSVALLLEANPGYKVFVVAHADSRGPFEYNLKLTNRRALSVKQYLLTKGVPASKIITRGLGETYLLNECADGVICTEEQHSVNRRVEMKLVK